MSRANDPWTPPLKLHEFYDHQVSDESDNPVARCWTGEQAEHIIKIVNSYTKKAVELAETKAKLERLVKFIKRMTELGMIISKGDDDGESGVLQEKAYAIDSIQL